jgi:ubiquinone/menaquinone biosynthesis C-methylase UbiE
LQGNKRRQLWYSAPVYRAIRRTGWKPDSLMWGDWPVIKAPRGEDDGSLEIVRILVWPAAADRDPETIGTLDFDHKFFAIPLFIIDPSRPSGKDLSDFTIGFDREGQVETCYEFRDDRGKVEEASPKRGFSLSEAFIRVLDDPELKTVDEFLGYRIMIRDPRDLQQFAETYDRQRRASKKIVNFLRSCLRPGPTKVGLDIGCGTGNYTVPFVEDFGTLYGLDINEEMLAVARQKSDKIRWLRANALRTGLEPASCDAVWLISTLHYLESDGQKYLFREIHRILKPGGTFVADTEFLEQHAAFWLVEYFPSLRERFRDAIFSTKQYDLWLRDVGFRDFRFEKMDYDASEGDAFLRIGQHQPGLYLKQEIRDVIPAFKQMSISELQRGLELLRRAIDDNSIEAVISQYQSRATMPGDLGFIVAQK